MPDVIEPIELQEFIKKIVSDIETAAERRAIYEQIEFEISVSQTIKVGGDVKIYVVGGK